MRASTRPSGVRTPVIPSELPFGLNGYCSVGCRYSITKKTKKIPGKAGIRFYKNVGLGFKTPKEAIEGKARCIRIAVAIPMQS